MSDNLHATLFTLGDGREVMKIQAGRPLRTRTFQTFRVPREHEIEVYSSATGRSVRVYIDGVEVEVPRSER